MAIEIKGTVTAIMETKSVGAKGFQKREFVVTTEEKYPQALLCEATGDRIQSLDGVNEGDTVTVSLNLKGRKWDGPNGAKWFVTLEAWRIERAGTARTSAASSSGGSMPQDEIPFLSCDMNDEPSAIARVIR